VAIFYQIADNGGVPSEPGVPISVAKTSNAITLKWSQPKKGVKSVDHYQIAFIFLKH
jgi:hypothetical protein